MFAVFKDIECRLLGDREIIFLPTDNKSKSNSLWKDFVFYVTTIKDVLLDTVHVHVPPWVFAEIMSGGCVRQWRFQDDHLPDHQVGFYYPAVPRKYDGSFKVLLDNLVEWLPRQNKRYLVLRSMKPELHPSFLIVWTLIVL